MRSDYVTQLQSALPSIGADLVFADVAAPLIEKNVLAPAEYQAVLSSSTDYDRAVTLVDILAGKEDNAFNAFIEILRADYSWLVDAIIGQISQSDVTDSVPISREHAVRCRNEIIAERERSGCCNESHSSKRCHSPPTHRGAKRRSGRSPATNALIQNNDLMVQSGIEVSGNVPTPAVTAQYSTANEENLSQAVTDDMIDILKRNHRLSKDWTSLAHALKLSRCVHKIRTSIFVYGDSLDLCLVNLLQEWRGEDPSAATLLNLLKVLRSEKFNDVADELENKFAK